MKSKNLIIMIVVVLSFLSGQLNAEEVVGKSIFPNIETPQTYPEAVKGKTLVWSTTIQEPGAAWIKIHFSKFRLNPGDYIDMVDMNGSLIERIKGIDISRKAHSKFNVKSDVNKTFSFWGPAIDGNKVTVELHSIELHSTPSKPNREKGMGFHGDKAGINGTKTTAELHTKSNTKEGMGFIIDEVGIGYQPILNKAMETLVKEDEKIDMSVFPFWKNNPRMSRMKFRGNPVDIVSSPIGKMLYRKNATWYTCKGSINSSLGKLFYPGENCLDSVDILDTLEVRFFLEYTTKKNVKNIPRYYTYYSDSDSIVEGESSPFITQITLRNDNQIFSLDRKVKNQHDNNEDRLSEIYEEAGDYHPEDEAQYAAWASEDFDPPLGDSSDTTDPVVRIWVLTQDQNNNWYEIETVSDNNGNLAKVRSTQISEPGNPCTSADEISRTSYCSRCYCCWVQYWICELMRRIFWWRQSYIYCYWWYYLCMNYTNFPCYYYFDPWGMYWRFYYWYGIYW